MPLGWFGRGAGAKALEAFGNDIDDLHTAVAHGRLERTAAVVSPAAVLLWFVIVDWRLTLVVIAPTLLYLFQRSLKQKDDGMRPMVMGMIALTTAIGEMVRDMATLRTNRGARRGQPIASRTRAGSDQLVDAMSAVLETQARTGWRNLMLVDPVTTLVVTLLGAVALISAGWLNPIDMLPFLLAGAAVTTPIQAYMVAHSSLGEATGQPPGSKRCWPPRNRAGRPRRRHRPAPGSTWRTSPSDTRPMKPWSRRRAAAAAGSPLGQPADGTQ